MRCDGCSSPSVAVDGPRLAALSQKRLGFVDVASAAGVLRGGGSLSSRIGDLFGVLLGQSPDRGQFDRVREDVWSEYQGLVSAVDADRRENMLSSDALSAYANALDGLTRNFEAYYSRVRDAVGPDWGDPRYRSHADPMASTAAAWRAEADREIMLGPFSGVQSGTQALVLGAVALAVVMGMRSRRSK